MRLIDADELKIDFGFTWDDIAPTREEMFEIIDRQPTVDAVEVVRCKDCKWKQGGECVMFSDVRPFPYDFCSRAERKEGEAE